MNTNQQKKLFKQIFLITAIVLSLLPVIVTFSALLTSIFEKMGWYIWLQEVIVPVESRLVAVLVRPVGIKGMVTSNANFSMVLERPSGALLPVALEWNCLGWQSMLLLGITLSTGLRGRYTGMSKLEVIIFGVLGTFLVNLLRMAFIVSLAFYWNNLAAMIIHDYFAALVALVWMIFFWYFAYSYMLEPDANKMQMKNAN